MTLIPNYVDAIGQTLFGIGGQAFGNSQRVPMIFTSTRRLKFGKIEPDIKSFSTQDKLATQNIKGEMTAIEMAVNPNSVTFRQPKRITKRDTQEGSVYFHFTNSQGENNDILTLEFRGNTGNLNLQGSIDTTRGVFDNGSASGNGANKKLQIWHNLWALTREPMLVSSEFGTYVNQFLIIYSSTGIPMQISLIGHFNSVLEFTETADKPFTRDYSMSFTVQEIVPPLNDLMQLLQSYNIDTQTTAGQI